MYYVYADDNLIYNQFDRSLTIHSPKVSLELGKAGSFQFDIPPTNQYYSSLTQLKTNIRVELDNKTVFYGRVFSITRNFNNIKHVYCEGALSYLIDTLQQAKSYKGKAKQLFRDIISAHNSLVQSWQSDVDKRFVIDRLEIEDTDVIIPGKKDKDGKYYGDEYEQTIIESIAEEWLTTYDYINNVLIEYLGGYLMYEYDSKNKRNKISYVSESSFDDEIEEATRNNLSAPEIDYGINMLDLTEELNAEDLCTVLIPLGDDGLTIEKATNKTDHSDIRIEYIDNKPIAISDVDASDKYGKIVKSYVFDNVNEANTLFTNGYKYLKAHKNVPISFTVKAVDMHFVDSSQQIIGVGELAKLNSTPHNLVQYLICTKVEYDLEDASKNQYTFGNPKQSMTERYKKNKEKEKQRQSSNSRKSAGTALATAADIAQSYAQEVSDNYANIKTWVEDHYAGIEEAVQFVSDNGEGFVRSTKWVDEYSANAEEVLTWHGKYSESAVSTIKWANDNEAGVQETIAWYSKYAKSTVDNLTWANYYSAGAREAIKWHSQYANSSIVSTKWVDDYKAFTQNSIQWYNKNAAGAVNAINWVGNNYATFKNVATWYTTNGGKVTSSSLTAIEGKADAAQASVNLIATYDKKTASIVLTADTQKSIVNVVADEINASNSKILANILTANNVQAAVLNTSADRVKIDNQGIMMSAGTRVEISAGLTGSGYISAPKILGTSRMYVNCGGASNPTSPGDDYKVLNQNEINAKISNAIKGIDKSYITKTLKGDRETFDDYLVAVLTGLPLKIENTATFHYNRLYKSLPDVIKAVIDDYVNSNYINDKITSNRILTLLEGKDVNCNSISVNVNEKQTNLLTKFNYHTHGIAKNKIVIKSVSGKLTNPDSVTTTSPL